MTCGDLESDGEALEVESNHAKVGPASIGDDIFISIMNLWTLLNSEEGVLSRYS